MGKYTVDLSINTQGYADGIEEAKKENAQFSSSVINADKSLTSLQKELGKARREVKNLALEYTRLSKEEKNSASGRALQVQLAEAKKAAAELIDLNGDIAHELQTMASDTAGWDAMKEGIGIAKDGLSALAITLGDATGNEKAFKEVIAQVAKIQTIANTAISIGNALQKQSAVMCGIRNVQEKALTKAITLETSATKGATIAQRVFNAVAKANPYVLLATAILTAAAAIGTFLAITHKNTEEEKKQQAEIKRSQKTAEEYAQAVGNEYGKLRYSYEELRAKWNTLKTDHEKNKFLKDNKTKINELTSSVKDLTTAEQFFNNNTSYVVKSFEYRARAAAAAANAMESYKEMMKYEMEAHEAVNLNGMKMTVEAYEKLSDELKKKAKPIIDHNKFGGAFISGYKFEGLTEADNELVKAQNLVSKKMKLKAEEAERHANAFRKLAEEARKNAQKLNAYNEGGSTGDDNKDKDKTTKEQLTQLDKLEKKAEETSKKIKSIPPVKLDTEEGKAELKKLNDELEAQLKDIQEYRIKIGLDPDPNSIEGLQKQISDIEESLRKGLIPDEFPTIEEAKKKLKELKDQKTQVEIEWGFKEPEEKIKELERTLEQKKKDLKLAWDSNDQDAIKAAQDAVHAAQREVDQEKINVKIVAELSLLPEEIEKLKQDVVKELDDIEFDGLFDKEWDFSGFSDSMQKECAQVVQYYDNLKNEIKKADEIINDPARTDAERQIAAERKQWAIEQTAATEENLNQLQEESNRLVTQKDLYENLGVALEGLGEVFGALSQLFKDNEEMQIALIIAQAIAQVALSFAKALASCNSWIEWLAFAFTGTATMISTIAQIKSATSGSYAGGGIIPGSSYAGDRLTANVNSGEMILNKRQQKNLFDIANTGMKDGSEVQSSISFKIKGEDLYGTIKNYSSIHRKKL